MDFIELEEDNLKQLLEQHDKVMVQFGATWCGNCRLIKPKFKKMAPKYEDVLFAYVDAEKFPESRSTAKVENLPTFAVYRGAKLVNQIAGSKPEILEELIHEITNN